MTRWFLRFAGVLIMFGAFSCRGGCSGDSLAVLIGVNGTVQRDFAASIGDWEAATVSAKFKFDDGVSTGKESSAELELDDGATAMLESNTTVRFRSTNDQPSLDVEMGAALIETKASGLVLDTEIGSATILAGSRVYIRRKGGKIRFEVSVGRANFETLDGKTMEVGAGQKLLVDIGNAVIEIEVPEPVPELKSEPEPEPEIIEEIPTGPVSASISGRGATMKAPGSKKWEVLKKGPNQLPEGSTLKLPRGVNADLQHGSMTATLRGSGNFVVAPAPGVLVEAQSGSLALTGAEVTVRVTVPGGSIIAKPLARADVTVRRKDTKISVIAGEVRLESEEGSQDLASGESAALKRKGSVKVSGRGPAYADIRFGIGASAAIHDPRPPTSVGLSFVGKCEEVGVIQLLRAGRVVSSSRGEGTANIYVPGGSYSYVLRCLTGDGLAKETSGSGSIAVYRDSGQRRLPRSAPPTQVETDGRRYTVLYQNHLPRVSVLWPNAPKAGGYTLSVASPTGSKSVSTSRPNHSFRPGALGEGTHKLTFRSSGGRSSKTTSLSIRFDNAAATASIKTPKNGTFTSGNLVTVSGACAPGWSASVGGVDLPLDGQYRFSGQTTAPTNQRAIGIRLAHPSRGVHYYLRRAAE
ncbi:MAG: FecR domain-containing protein [Polyangiaceae bacterium]|nr:FecR domain-containing protein [Polyangiaceae bacterium]